MRRLLFLCCMIAATCSLARKWDATYIAKLIAKGGSDKVIQYYQQRYYGPNRDPQDAFRIAELYVKKKDYATAMQWYTREQQLINTSKVNLFNYANTCRLMGEYQKALDGYLMYAAQTGDVNKVMDLANQCEKILKASAQADNFKLENYTYNTPYDETNLSVLRNNTIYITIQKAYARDQKPVYMPHQVVRDFQNFSEPVPVLSSSLPSLRITGLSYTRDGNTVAYSVKEDAVSSKKKGPKESEKIYIADNLGGNFLHPKPLPFNADGYSFSHPALNSDGTVLYFSSNIPGGFGGTDIWKSVLQNGSWSAPINLGPLLNSKANEQAPFLIQDQKDNTLYFSSDRDGGFGGYDIYAGKNIDKVWQDVEMQPAPINSPGDDVSVIYDNDINTGYVSSDRTGGKGGFDIYRFTPFNLRLIINTKDSATRKPVDYALVQLSQNGIKVNEGVTNDDGRAVFQIGKEKTFLVNVSKDNYRPQYLTLSSAGKISGDSVVADLLLKQDEQFSILKGATNNLSMDNYIIFTGQVMDASTNKPAKTAKMRMVNYTTNKLRELDLDQDGRFQIKLLMNNSYKVIFENQDSKVTDELTTYGLEKFDIKVRDYLLSGSKLKLTENRVFNKDNLPAGIRINPEPKQENSSVTRSEIDSLVRSISKEKELKETKKLVPAEVKKSSGQVPENKSANKPKEPLAAKVSAAPVKNAAADTVQKQIVAPAKEAIKGKLSEPKKLKLETAGKTKADTIPFGVKATEQAAKPKEIKAEPVPVKETIKESTAVVQSPPVAPHIPAVKTDTLLHPDVYYKIQLGSYPEGNLTFPEFEQIGKTEVIESYGQYVYRLGDIYSSEEAKKILDKVRTGGYYGAFILQYYKNKVTGIVK